MTSAGMLRFNSWSESCYLILNCWVWVAQMTEFEMLSFLHFCGGMVLKNADPI